MSSRYNKGVYILLGIILIVGILVFVFKDRLLSALSTKVFGDTNNSQEVLVKTDDNNLIDITVLDRPNLKQLDNRVLYFDFDQVGKPVLNKTLNPNLQTPAWSAVYLGNSHPFMAKEKEDK